MPQRRNYNRPPFGSSLGLERKHTYSIVAIGVLIVVLIGFYVYMKDIKTSHVTFTVQSKERVTSGSNGNISSKYMVFTTGGEAYTVSDNALHGHFNSSNTYASLKEHHEYECEVTGWRIPLFSSYENIIGCKELK